MANKKFVYTVIVRDNAQMETINTRINEFNSFEDVSVSTRTETTEERDGETVTVLEIEAIGGEYEIPVFERTLDELDGVTVESVNASSLSE